VYILDASTGGTTLTLKGHTSPVTSLVFSPNGDLLATTGTVNLPPNRDGAVRIWDVKSGNQLAVFKTPGISQLSFSPDGSLLAGAGGGDPLQVTIWDVANRSEKRTLKGIFKCVSFNPGGNLLASGSRDDQLHLVNAAAVEEPRILSGHAGWVDATVFSPQGGTLASGGEDNNVIVWDSATGNKVQTFSGHQSGIGFLAFSPDGNVLVSLGSGTNVTRQGNQISVTMGPKDKSLRFWDIKAGKELLHVDEPDGISGVSLSSDWGLMATSSGKDVIQLWSISL
jgi:WD40 repeat protein